MQDFGVSKTEYQDNQFIGDHPPILMPATLLSGENLVHGTVVGTVTASGKRAQFDQDAADGLQTATGIIVGDLDASGGDEPGVFFEHGIAIDMYLTWPADITDGEKAAAIAQLKSAGVFVK